MLMTQSFNGVPTASILAFIYCSIGLKIAQLSDRNFIINLNNKIMIYGYIRVSTDRQTVENQRFEINQFCDRNVLVVDKWIEETISGTKTVQERKLGKLFKKMKKEDILICSELSRLGRNLLMIMGILNECMNRNVQVWTIKDNYRLGSDINSKVLAFAFGLSAEIERNLISQRTKEALARKRAEGVILGRPKGSKSKVKKLTGKEAEIKTLLENKVAKSAIARILGVHRLTVSEFVKNI
jgi:DNA invertase Pin-like site-specific DNA recombinase